MKEKNLNENHEGIKTYKLVVYFKYNEYVYCSHKINNM